MYNNVMAISNERIHPAQVTTLKTLEQATRARFSELQRAANMESDTFKFHASSLKRAGLIFKDTDGLYQLTAEGKSMVSRLDKRTRRQIEQPKSSMLMIVRANSGKILAHKRTREPFNGYWGIASAPMLRGVPAADSASRELKRQTGITANFTIKGAYRLIDKDMRGNVLEDKLFAVAEAVLEKETSPISWCGGVSEWMNEPNLLAKEKLFPTTAATLDMIESGEVFKEDICVYESDEY